VQGYASNVLAASLRHPMHVVPGFFDVDEFGDRIVAVPLVLEVDDEGRHLNHFARRETGVRPA